MDPLPPSTRRANRWLFAALIVFAIALAIVVFLWMQGVVRANGGIADPRRKGSSLYVPSREPAARTDFVLPIAAGEGRSQARRSLDGHNEFRLLPLPSSELLPSYF